MIRVTIELFSAKDGSVKKLGVMEICNDGTSTDPKRGNYDGLIYRKGEPRGGVYRGEGRGGRVENYPRDSYVVWRLILRMLRNMYPGEK